MKPRGQSETGTRSDDVSSYFSVSVGFGDDGIAEGWELGCSEGWSEIDGCALGRADLELLLLLLDDLVEEDLLDLVYELFEHW